MSIELESTVLPWGRVPLSLTSQVHFGTLEEFQRLVQTAWLLLLTTYDRNAMSSCYFHGAGAGATFDLLSLSTTKSMKLDEHMRLIRTRTLTGNERDSAPSSMIWQGPEPQDWKAQYHSLSEHGNLDFILLIHGIQSTEQSTHNHDFEASLSLLFDQSSAKLEVEDAIGRAETLKTIFAALVDFPMSILGDTNFLSHHDQNRILTWNQPPPGPLLEMTIPSGFAVNVADCPDAPAIFAWDGEMTYLELDTASSKVAALLQQAGQSGPNDMVLFNMRKSKWALVAALAILKSGKAIVPTDLHWPQSRLDQIVEITGARLTVCDEGTKGKFGGDRVREIIVAPAPDLPQIKDASFLQTACSPNDLAFVLFSSGSTGVPKGMLRQQNTACTGSFAHAKAMHLDRTSRVFQFANHVFDVAMLDFFTTLLVGGCVCIPSEIDRKNDLAGFIGRSQANWALLTPTVASLLDPLTVPSFKFVTLGGEAINRATLQKWLKVCRVGINYGSAEVDVTHTRDVYNDTDISNVGERIPSCAAYIVDQQDPTVILPVGAVGELVICGPTMARGYLNAPERTANVFMSLPKEWILQGVFGQEGLSTISRIYRMGDLCRQKSDGSLEFVGRKDFQVKVSGQKVELGDIESKLIQHPAVKQCAVLYPGRGPYTKRLVAMVQSFDSPYQQSRHTRASIGTNSSAPDLRSITEFLSGTLPSYMLPTVFVGLTNMPYTATMKIDRNRLQSWLLEDDVVDASQGAVFQIPTALVGPSLSADEGRAMELSNLVADVVSEKHSAIWKSISGHDNRFEDIGINSAQMMRLAHIITKQLKTKVYVEMLGSKEMTIRKLAALLNPSEEKINTQEPLSLVETKVGFLQDRVAKISRTVLESLPNHESPTQQHVFLTGSSGYLGVQILVQLLQSKSIGSVTVLIRSADERQALERVKSALTAAEEPVQHEDLSKIRAWPGDLSKASLGLSEVHWNEISNLRKNEIDTNDPKVDTIIHCGAVVDWRKSYTDLEAANVTSTEQLLRLALMSPGVNRFIFISGGRYPDPAQEDGQDLGQMYAETAKGSGYAQTKFVAERLVDNVRRATHCSTSIEIVSPAYLIGGQYRGIANQDDYLWRVVWASVRIGAFNADENDQWLFVAESVAVAERIVTLALQDQVSSPLKDSTLQILDGLSVHDFWRHVCNVLGVALLPVSGEIWLQKVRQDMEDKHDHLLWALADMLDTSYGQLTQRRCCATDIGTGLATAGVDLAIQRNLQRLKDVDFFV